MQFRVLGPLEASRDGEPIRLGGERQRALLALLLVHANELVSTERLIEQLFGGEPSDSARPTRSTSPSRDCAGRCTAATAALLHHPARRVSACARPRAARRRPVRAPARARAAGCCAAGDPAAAAARCARRSRCGGARRWRTWRCRTSWQPEVRRLQELRLLALMERIDADLALGHEAELIAEIEALVASEPLQERLRGQLMLALYRCGRRADGAGGVPGDQRAAARGPGARAEPARCRSSSGWSCTRTRRWTSRRRPPAPRRRRLGPSICPFKGLASFDTADADYFCGRERVVSDLWPGWPSRRWSGSSGRRGSASPRCCGPGVLPALRAGALPRSAGWRQVLLRPGRAPVSGARARARRRGPGRRRWRALGHRRADRHRRRSARGAVHGVRARAGAVGISGPARRRGARP